MSINELKSAWHEYDRKLQSTQVIHEKIITSMIKDRSASRFSVVKRNYMIGFSWMAICLLAGCAILFGNPFDYSFKIQYVPIIIYVVCLVILMTAMVKAFAGLNSITIHHHNLDVALKNIIKIYEQPQVFLKYTIIVFLFSQFILFPLSFLPPSIERLGLWPALGERLIPISISLLLFFIAYKLGAFKQRQVKKFKEDLSELEQLKAMSAELTAENSGS